MKSPRIEYKSLNFDQRSKGMCIDMLVIHYTGMLTAGAALERLCDPEAKVSAHYLIEENGQIAQLVDEENRAWHAGVSHWRGHTNINDRSIGVELVNPGHEFGYRPFPDRQMRALIDLSRNILARHSIPARNVVGHSDVAPTRKLDPGELFDWKSLAGAGVGVWPDGLSAAESNYVCLLEQIGYDVENVEFALKAFQRRYRRDRIDGVCDAETLQLLARVAAIT